MLKLLLSRVKQGHRTVGYPDAPPALPDRFRGAPALDPSRCKPQCRDCVEACPSQALSKSDRLSLDMGRCLFCLDCANTCKTHAIGFTREHRLAARSRDDLVIDGEFETKRRVLDERLRGLFGRSLKLRQVSAGGCNGCELDVNVLGTIVFDLGRFGIQIVASPRHADGLLVTGPVSENMHLALKKTYDAVPDPKIVIAVGACAISGGHYATHSQVHKGAASILPVDLFVPGCPPHPYTLLDGLLALIGRIETGGRTPAIADDSNARDEVTVAPDEYERESAVALVHDEIVGEHQQWGADRALQAVKYFGATDGRKP